MGAFFNRGTQSGFSQPHKHIQVVPFPLCPVCTEMPLSSKVDLALQSGEDQMDVPWLHALRSRASGTAAELRDLLRAAYAELNLHENSESSWNLLWTKRWLLAVPRAREGSHGVNVNALAFTGSFFVKSEVAVEQLERASPTKVLVNAGRSRL